MREAELLNEFMFTYEFIVKNFNIYVSKSLLHGSYVKLQILYLDSIFNFQNLINAAPCLQGCHGDLTSKESQILLAEFSLRHSKSALSIAHEYAKRKAVMCTPKL